MRKEVELKNKTKPNSWPDCPECEYILQSGPTGLINAMSELHISPPAVWHTQLWFMCCWRRWVQFMWGMSKIPFAHPGFDLLAWPDIKRGKVRLKGKEAQPFKIHHSWFGFIYGIKPKTSCFLLFAHNNCDWSATRTWVCTDRFFLCVSLIDLGALHCVKYTPTQCSDDMCPHVGNVDGPLCPEALCRVCFDRPAPNTQLLTSTR